MYLELHAKMPAEASERRFTAFLGGFVVRNKKHFGPQERSSGHRNIAAVGEELMAESASCSSHQSAASTAHIGIASRSFHTFECQGSGWSVSVFGVETESRSSRSLSALYSRYGATTANAKIPHALPAVDLSSHPHCLRELGAARVGSGVRAQSIRSPAKRDRRRGG